MAGYLFLIGGESNDEEEDRKRRVMDVVQQGMYSTMMSPKWSSAAEGTLGDFITMKPGDNVYFFGKRKVYGIGSIIDAGNGRAVTENFNGATLPRTIVDYDSDCIVPSSMNDKVGRWVVAFKPDPAFFDEGIDMDDLLSSNPGAIRSLRVIERRTFIKLDDEENLAFMAAFVRRNLDTIRRIHRRQETIPFGLQGGSAPDVKGLIAEKRKRDGSLSSEMLVEIGLLYQLARNDPRTISVFGNYDYLSHQVNASPFKPVLYMDKIDVFGYRYIEGYRPIVEKYLVAELKKDGSGASDIPQVMKYVDFVRNEYAHGDYSMISAYLVAHSFGEDAFQGLRRLAKRDYVTGQRTIVAHSWTDLTLVTYNAMPDGYIEFTRCSR